MMRLLFVMMVLMMTFITKHPCSHRKEVDPDNIANATCKALFVLNPLLDPHTIYDSFH